MLELTINGKTYYEEIKDDDNVIDPEVVDNRKSQRIKYDSEEDSSSKKSSETMFSKENLKRDWNEFVSSMKGLGTKISKKVKRTTKDWFQDSPATEDTTNRLLKILPYMDKDDIHGIAKRILKNDKEFKDVDYAAIMPFMTRKDCDAIFLKTLKDGDTIVLKVDNEVWDLDVISQFHENISNCFPKNNVLTILNGMEIGVINRN